MEMHAIVWQNCSLTCRLLVFTADAVGLHSPASIITAVDADYYQQILIAFQGGLSVCSGIVMAATSWGATAYSASTGKLGLATQHVLCSSTCLDLHIVVLQTKQVLGGTRSTRADAEVLADQSVLSHYRRLRGKDTASTSASADGPAGLASKQRPVEGECAICYDSLKVGRSVLQC